MVSRAVLKIEKVYMAITASGQFLSVEHRIGGTPAAHVSPRSTTARIISGEYPAYLRPQKRTEGCSGTRPVFDPRLEENEAITFHGIRGEVSFAEIIRTTPA